MYRICAHCKKKKVLNDKNFRRYWSGIGGQYYLHTWCKNCEHEYQEAQRAQKRVLATQEARKTGRK